MFVPLTLAINPELPEGLLGKKKDSSKSQSRDGLNTGIALPAGEDVINMADLSKDDFLSVIRKSGVAQ